MSEQVRSVGARLTPLDIHNRNFRRRAFGGYDRDEVDQFLDEVIREFERLIRETDLYREQAAALEERLKHYRQIEETLNQTLIVAQSAAEEVRKNAEREGELILAAARQQADNLLAEARAELAELRASFERARREQEALRSRLRGLLQAQLDLLAGEESAAATTS